ncbi:hypothetical protein [Photobacterium leiognathi]|uniref:hypothetical protein n=1 Tax=Photobacterium leiognathi TaxID=553611 RepID=UPI00298225AF|nr:hypothetical protein [Photobacterium leiognathi]
MKNLNFWLESFDKLRVERNPFKAHITADSLNEHEQNQYAVLQATFVLANGVINQDQERLYGFWLTAINNNLSLSNVITQAQAIDLDVLRDGINLLEERGLVDHFLVDVLVFIRLAGGLSDNLKTILGEWCQLLSLSEAQLNDVITLTDHILAVKEPKPVKLTPTMELLLTNEIWQEFYVKPLTKEMLNNSINGGIWSLEKAISTECDINLTNTVVIFKNTATIKQINSKLILINVGLINPVFDLYNVAMSFEKVIAVGKFDKEQKITSFTSNSTPEFSIKKSKFELINARCFKFKDEESKGLFDTTVFKYCGNEYLNGGVASYKQGVKFNSCKFSDCISKIGSVIYCQSLIKNSIKNCKLISCDSKLKWDALYNAGGIYCNSSEYNSIVDSKIKSSISIYYIQHCFGENALINNTYFSGEIYHKYNDGFLYVFDENSKVLNDLSSLDELIKPTNVEDWSGATTNVYE